MDFDRYAGRPCYIAHDEDFPADECDGLHGLQAIQQFYTAEDAAVTSELRRRIYGTEVE